MTAALIIAAGRTSQSSGFSAMKPVGNLSAVKRLILVFQRAGVERVVLVGGEDFEEMERHVAHMGVICLKNEGGPMVEMLDSVKIGLAYLAGKCSRTLITPVDVPLFSMETVDRLVAAKAKIAIPSHKHRAGHPLLLSAKLFADVQKFEGEGGLAAAIKASGQPVQYVEVADEGVLIDIHVEEDVDALLLNHNLSRIHPEIKVYLSREKTFFGPGPYLLLSLIDETESLRVACAQMGISYSKGWKMVENMEKQMGQRLVERSRGGSEKGRSDLSAEGKALMRQYQDFYYECNRQMKRLFKKYFPQTKEPEAEG